jgi:membrane-associated phospholipid phosphatase
MSLDAIFPRYRIAYVVLALLVTTSRVVTCAHFLSDAVAGAYVAAVTCLLLKHFFTRTGIQLCF